jgi:hypothetical protein
MLSTLQKIVERIQSTDRQAESSPNSLFAIASRPFMRSQPAQPESVADDIALWKGLGSAIQASDMLIEQDLALQLQMALGACIWDSRKLAKGQIVQVQARSRLIALLDSRSMQAHVRPDAYPGDIDELISTPMTLQRAHIPAEFRVIPMWDLVWHYGYQHPMAWRQVPIEVAHSALNLRRLPLTSAEVLPSSVMQVIGQLVHGDASFPQLTAFSESPPEEVFRCLVALYLTRSVQVATRQASNDPKG